MTQLEQAMLRPKRGLSTGKKVGIGCGALAFLVLAVCGGGGYLLWRWFFLWPEKFVEKGYAMVSGQAVEVTEPVVEDTVYAVQSAVIRAPISADVAIWCQSAEIHGVVEGDVDFLGQSLLIGKEAVVKGDVRATAQIVTIDGVVEGEVSGSGQVVDNRSKRSTEGSPATGADGAPGAPPNEAGTREGGGNP